MGITMIVETSEIVHEYVEDRIINILLSKVIPSALGVTRGGEAIVVNDGSSRRWTWF